MRKTEIVGLHFGELEVLEDFKIKINNRSRRFLKCRCSCGKIVIKEKNKVVSGYTKSCGHLQKEMRKNLGELKKLPFGEATANETYENYKKNAFKRGYKFKLTKEEFKNIVTKPCFYCGQQGTQTKRSKQNNGAFQYTGIDRYDNTKGYEKENCVPCCKTCNMMKGSMTPLEFKERMEIILKSKYWEKKTK